MKYVDVKMIARLVLTNVHSIINKAMCSDIFVDLIFVALE